MDLTEEWLSVLPARGAPELRADELLALTGAPGVRAAGAEVEPRWGQDPSGQGRVRLRVCHAEAEVVAQTRDALLAEGRRLGLRVFLV